ncbi:MAG: hypothetical protein HY865_03475 [Chloroflexi bacterium]|nr:hypothetical protein [Chloroflexota bacterium]
MATPNAQLLCYAVVFRISSNGIPDGAYVFSVCDQQQFLVEYKSDQDDGQVFTPWTYSDAIRSGDWNTLAVSARGDHFVLSINNVVVSEFTDERRESGYVHLMVQFFEQVPGTVMFDNFGLQPK